MIGSVRGRPTAASTMVAAVTCALVHAGGIGITPDGWAYWQAAVSMADGHGYRYFSGDPIVSWPPGYALFLSAWVRALGPSAVTIVAANGTLIVLQAGGWTALALDLWQRSGGRASGWRSLAVALYVGLLTSTAQVTVGSEALRYALLPFALMAAMRAIAAPATAGVWRATAASSALLTLILLTHNTGAAFMVAVACSLWLLNITGRSARHLTAMTLAVCVVPVVSWLASRWLLGQQGSHLIGVGVARFSPAAYGLQGIYGIGELTGAPLIGWPPVAFASLVLMLVASRGALLPRIGARFAGVIVLVSGAALYALFNVTRVNDPLGARFLLFVPLLLVPLVMLAAPRLWVWLLVAALTAPVATRAATLVYVASTQTAGERGFPEFFVPLDAFLSHEYRSGPPVMTPHGLLMAPIAWQEPPAPPQ